PRHGSCVRVCGRDPLPRRSRRGAQDLVRSAQLCVLAPQPCHVLVDRLGPGSRSVTAHLPGVTVSIRVMTAGEGYRYLLNSVVIGGGDRDAASALTRYYLEAGTPWGRKSSHDLDRLFSAVLAYRFVG